MPRKAEITRNTNETRIRVELDLGPVEGSPYENKTGVGFFDHMLDHIAKHSRFGLNITANGDHHIDDHHTVEDVGIVLGSAINEALGDKAGIERYGSASVPMDEALATVSIDLSGRAALVFNASFTSSKIGAFDTQLVEEFLIALTANGKFACHVQVPHGQNDHHIAEAIFKALGRALRQAVAVTGTDIPSTKGTL